MKENTRLIATLIIWIALAAVVGPVLTSSTGAIREASDGTLFGIVAILTIAAMISTIAIWVGGARAAASQAQNESHFARGKNKRLTQDRLGQDRIARLIDSLDDEDIYDLEALLLARDSEGEIPRRQQE